MTSPGLTTDWNVLSSPWLEAMDLQARPRRLSVLDALRSATKLHQIVAASPLDLFAGYRFLVTLLYWKSPLCGGVANLREALLNETVPTELIDALEGEVARFNLLDSKQPFMQDNSVRDAKRLPPSSLFAEMASGTNVAHFHHGDDEASCLCLRCATLGLLRLVPWTQSGGAGKQPSLHGAPPIAAIAMGTSLCQTLGLNLVPPTVALGKPQWTGQFTPTDATRGIQLLEGLTWNPRRVHLGAAEAPKPCCNCGASYLPTVGPIVFQGNPACKQDGDRADAWRDPSAFYKQDDHRTVKSSKEATAATASDLQRLHEQRFGKRIEPAPETVVGSANPLHGDWLLVVPCTNPANNKSFDHRIVRRGALTGPAPERPGTWFGRLPWRATDERTLMPRLARKPTAGTYRFVSAAAGLDSHSWAVVASAAGQSMNENPAAFDIFTGLYWPLRTRDPGVPSRNAAWLALKVMASAGAGRPRLGAGNATFRPWQHIETAAVRDTPNAYRRRMPAGRALEVELRGIIRTELARNTATIIDWPGLCQFLNEITP